MYQVSLKIFWGFFLYLHFQSKKALMKSDTFDFKSLPTIPATTILPPLS